MRARRVADFALELIREYTADNSGLMAAALSFVFTPNVAIVGASGAIFGVLIGYGHFWPRDRIFIWGIIPIEVRFFILIMTALSLFGGFSGEGGNIAHFAHLGGFLGGWLYIQWYSRRGHHAAFQQVIPVGTVNAGDLQRWNAINREALHEVNREEYDRIMMKLRTNGPESMTLNERQFLNRFSQD